MFAILESRALFVVVQTVLKLVCCLAIAVLVVRIVYFDYRYIEDPKHRERSIIAGIIVLKRFSNALSLHNSLQWRPLVCGGASARDRRFGRRLRRTRAPRLRADGRRERSGGRRALLGVHLGVRVGGGSLGADGGLRASSVAPIARMRSDFRPKTQ
jgi:hypothetical protein